MINLTRLMVNYSYIQELTLSGNVTDEILQYIFCHMVNLKSLKFKLSELNTIYGLIGRRHHSYRWDDESNSDDDNTDDDMEYQNVNEQEGYSIARLENLEQWIYSDA